MESSNFPTSCSLLSCTVANCSVARYRQRVAYWVFDHIRSYRKFEEISFEFRNKHSLEPCSYCGKSHVSRSSNGANLLARHEKSCRFTSSHVTSQSQCYSSTYSDIGTNSLSASEVTAEEDKSVGLDLQ